MSMIVLAFSAAVAMAGADHVRHDRVVEHGGARYDVSYRPHLATEMRTVGAAVGARPGVQRCQWTTRVAVQRTLRGAAADKAMEHMLPGHREISGSVPGSCATARNQVAIAIAGHRDTVRDHVAEVARADEDRARTDIAAARSLALN